MYFIYSKMGIYGAKDRNGIYYFGKSFFEKYGSQNCGLLVGNWAWKNEPTNNDKCNGK